MRAPQLLLMALWATLGACSDQATAPSPVPGPSPRAVTVAYCTGIEPSWVAFQDGDGSWTRAFPHVGGANTTFHQVFATNRAGIATLSTLAEGALTLVSVLYGTPAELASVGDTLPIDCRAGLPKTLLGSVAGLDTNESAFVNARFSSRALVLPAAGGTSPEAFVPATASLSIAGLGSEGATSGTELRTTNGEMVFSFVTNQSTAVTRPFFALPAGRLLPGDLQTLHVSTDGPSNVNRTADLYFRSPSDRTVMLGAPLITPAISAVATAPSLRVRAQFLAQSDYDRATSILFEQAPTSALVSISMTAAYGAITGGGYDLTVPDLSGVAGFNPDWALRSGIRLDWSAIRIGGTLALGRDAVPSDGATQRRAFRKDTITVR